MKILGISGDPHGKMSNLTTFQAFLDHLNAFSQKCDTVVILGDLFNNHALVRSEVLNEWTRYFRNIDRPHIVLVGNHDKVSPESSIHVLNVFRDYKNVAIVDKPAEIDSVLFMPYVHTVEEFKRAIKDTTATRLVCHQTFDGAMYDNGFYAPHGIPMDAIKQFQLVISGHIHREQEFGNVWYPGSPFAMNFMDAGEEKSLWLYNLETGKKQKFPTILPKYCVQAFKSASHDIIGWVRAQDAKHTYKLIVTDTRASIQTLQESAEFRQLKEKYNITLHPKYTDTVKIEVKISDTISSEEMLKKYITEVIETNVDKNKLLEKSLELLKGEA